MSPEVLSSGDGPARQPAVSEGSAFGGTVKLLIAEDDPQVREFQEIVLRRAGYELLVAKDGEEAIRLYDEQGEGLGLAILDVVMPSKTGAAAAEYMWKRQPGLPVLFCTGYADQCLGDGNLAGHCVLVLRKPFRHEDLVESVRALLAQADAPASRP